MDWFPIRHSKSTENACASQVMSNVEHSSRKPMITRVDIEVGRKNSGGVWDFT